VNKRLCIKRMTDYGYSAAEHRPAANVAADDRQSGFFSGSIGSDHQRLRTVEICALVKR
jgi:hypothetical protein